MSNVHPEGDPRVPRLRRALRILIIVTIPVQIVTIISIPAFPFLFLWLILPNVALVTTVVLLDRQIVKSGGSSFWRDGRFQGWSETPRRNRD